MEFSDLDQLSVNTIRALAVDTVQKANSGHPGLPMGAAPMAYVCWTRHLRVNPRDPDWPDRDRFVLSAGHGSALVYALLHLCGYDLSLEDLQSFRQWGSRTPGHPEFGMTPGVEATTGPLGQGTANAVGMAMAERVLAHRFNRPGHTVVDHRTFALVSDGDLMEGISAEACSLAGHLGLGKLIYLYDANGISLDGPTSLTFTEDTAERYRACGWQVLHVEDGDTNLAAIDRAIAEAVADEEHPSLVVINTTIGYGSPAKSGKAAAHGAPLGDDEVRAMKEALGLDPDRTFHVPGDVLPRFRSVVSRGEEAQARWKEGLAAWGGAHPDLAREWEREGRGELPGEWAEGFPAFPPGEALATRAASGKILSAIAARVPNFMGGDADLSSSTKTNVSGAGDFEGSTGAGRNVRFGVREHAMAAVANGAACHGGLRFYASTFFVFSDYMRPSIRLAAMNGLPVIYVWTHDSVAVGEDGPTHQPVEHLMALRTMPGLRVWRPADAGETAGAWRHIMENADGPAALVLTRQKVPTLGEEGAGPEGAGRGGYVLRDPRTGPPRAVIIATGSEVHPALGAQELLAAEGVGVRVVSMPSWEVFSAQTEAYRRSVLPPDLGARVSVEAGVTLGWERWVGEKGTALGIDRFGASAPGGQNLEKFGFTAEAVAGAVRKVLEK
jgi:transketolase